MHSLRERRHENGDDQARLRPDTDRSRALTILTDSSLNNSTGSTVDEVGGVLSLIYHRNCTFLQYTFKYVVAAPDIALTCTRMLNLKYALP